VVTFTKADELHKLSVTSLFTYDQTKQQIILRRVKPCPEYFLN